MRGRTANNPTPLGGHHIVQICNYSSAGSRLVISSFSFAFRAGVAQLVEQLIRNQQVTGSSPIAGSKRRLNNSRVGERGTTAANGVDNDLTPDERREMELPDPSRRDGSFAAAGFGKDTFTTMRMAKAGFRFVSVDLVLFCLQPCRGAITLRC